MYHSISFVTLSDAINEETGTYDLIGKNTWDDWHIVPSSRPVLKPPTQKTNYVDIPGADGVLDFSDALTGYPVYNNREGSFEFLVMNDYQPWEVLYSQIMEHLHGQRMQMVLEDDNKYFYDGRFEVEEWKSTHPWSTIVIKYNVAPYKWSISKTTDDWLWDPFSFIYGKIQPAVFKNITIDSNEWVLNAFDKYMFEQAPVCPDFIVSSNDGAGIDVRYINHKLGIDKTKHLNDGHNLIPEFVFYGENIYRIYFKGHGSVSMNFRSGRL